MEEEARALEVDGHPFFDAAEDSLGTAISSHGFGVDGASRSKIRFERREWSLIVRQYYWENAQIDRIEEIKRNFLQFNRLGCQRLFLRVKNFRRKGNSK